MPEAGGIQTRLTGPVLGMLGVVAVLVTSLTLGLYRQIELKTLDLRYRWRPAVKQSPRILHVDIDDTSIESFGRWQSWSRERHAILLRRLKELGAETVMFDIEFSEPGDTESDKEFAEAIRDTGFTILPFSLRVKETVPEDEELERRISTLLRDNFDANASQIAGQLGVSVERVEARLASLKKQVAREVGWEILLKGKLDDAVLLKRLLPEIGEIESAEKEMIPGAVDYCHAARRIYQVDALDSDSRDAFVPADVMSPPIAVLTEGAVGFGACNAKPDDEDGVIRHIPLIYNLEGRLLPHISLAGACRMLGTDVKAVDIVPGSHLVIHPKNNAAGSVSPIVIPVDDQCRVLVNWAGSPDVGWTGTFEHVPYGKVLELDELNENLNANNRVFRVSDFIVRGKWSEVDKMILELKAAGVQTDEQRAEMAELVAARREVEERILDFLKRQTARYTDEALQKEPQDVRDEILAMKHNARVIEVVWATRRELEERIALLEGQLRNIFRGRLCVVGMTATASTDLKPTPVQPVMPGVGVHSAVINSILQRSFVREAPQWMNVLFILLVGGLVSTVSTPLKTRWAALGTIGVLAGWTSLAWFIFAAWGWWIAITGPVLAGFLAYAVVTAWRQLTEERQKRHIRNTFQHYLSPTVVEEVLQNPAALRLGGQRRELTVFFSDVADFTPISERLKAEELVALLNEYLSEMSDVILESKGYINKYAGDGIMAVFGAPLSDPQHAATACRVALNSQRRLKAFREKLAADGRPEIRARIGLNSGVMIVGNMGSRKLFDYTVMGDNVNIGSRLESAGKQFGTQITIGEGTFLAVGDEFRVRKLGLVHVKGRQQPVGAYELLGEKNEDFPLIDRIMPAYSRGIAAYAEQRWDEAVEAFGECLKLAPDDGPTRAYLARTRFLRENPPEHWDGTFSLEMK